jgi:hypothetical protein
MRTKLILLNLLILTSCNLSKQRDLIKLKEAIDITNPTTRGFALNLASKNEGPFNIDQVCNVYSYIYENWKYVNDPRGIDYYSKASETIGNNLTGDCDDFAILMAATIESIGGKARINFVVEENNTGHAFAEVYLNEDPNIVRERIDIHYQNFFQFLFGISRVDIINFTPDEKQGIWLNLDWKEINLGVLWRIYTKDNFLYIRDGNFED